MWDTVAMAGPAALLERQGNIKGRCQLAPAAPAVPSPLAHCNPSHEHYCEGQRQVLLRSDTI